MTEAEVKAAITRDLGVAADKVSTGSNPMERTSLLVVRASLPPGPGEATISYIFGASSHKLTHVNVAWSTAAAPTAADRTAIVAAAAQLSSYFKAQPWDPKTANRTGLIGNGSGLLMFDASDAKGGNVEVLIENVPLSRTVNGKTETTDPKGPAVLRVSYDKDVAHPDVFQIKPGAF